MAGITLCPVIDFVLFALELDLFGKSFIFFNLFTELKLHSSFFLSLFLLFLFLFHLIINKFFEPLELGSLVEWSWVNAELHFYSFLSTSTWSALTLFLEHRQALL